MPELVTAVLVALIVAIGGTLSQLLLRRQDFQRQDQVAARVAEAAEALVADNTKVTEKLDQIHTLVNSNMTAAIRGELVATEAQLLLARRLAALEPSAEDKELFDTLNARIAELQATVHERSEQLAHAEAIIVHAEAILEP